ncbi:MAG: FMN phosphatase YigB (HAD superfamily) [Paraglaciecola sp.]|jgi:FMN phosphatase YigB (HAD superfamily)
MSKIYLFDWGDTLMIDNPEAQGKMCQWRSVTAVDDAADALAFLSQTSPIFIATNAADSSENEIKLAFERVGLSKYISGYFCQSNLGLSKETPGFYDSIISKLGVEASSVTMVGDTYEKDILPSLQAGLNAIWLNPRASDEKCGEFCRQIKNLRELCS